MLNSLLVRAFICEENISDIYKDSMLQVVKIEWLGHQWYGVTQPTDNPSLHLRYNYSDERPTLI